jgi:hypothetical protein
MFVYKPEDVWFHVDDLSSAHVYLRLKPGQTMDDIPPCVLEDCGALVKANSIQGCKVRPRRRAGQNASRICGVY